jgi:hypothetical protein
MQPILFYAISQIHTHIGYIDEPKPKSVFPTFDFSAKIFEYNPIWDKPFERVGWAKISKRKTKKR